MTIQCNFATLLAEKAQREKRHIALAEVSRLTGIDQRTLGSYAKDRVERYDQFVLDRLCQYLGCEVGQLLVRVSDKK